MSGHTPGPWSRLPQEAAGPMIVHEFNTGKQMNPTGFRLICHMLQRGSSLEEDQANARLIASAPELLEALKAVRVAPHHSMCQAFLFNMSRPCNCHVGLAKDAIQKAEAQS